MEYIIYSAEFKMNKLEEYRSSGLSMRAFCKENNIKLSTFESWAKKVRICGYPSLKMCATRVEEQDCKPIEVTKEALQIINEQQSVDTFTMETKGMKFTFSIKNIKEIIEVIKND